MKETQELQSATTRQLEAYLNILKFRMSGILSANQEDKDKNIRHIQIITDILEARKSKA